MKTNHASIRKAIRLLLLGILLAAQTLSFAHEVMHLSGDETELCDMCRIQSSSPAITNLDQNEFPAGLPTHHLPQCNSSIHGSFQPTGFHPRAPPSFL